MSFNSKIFGTIAGPVLQQLATNRDTQATLLGALAAGVLASNIDFSQLFAGNGTEIGKTLGVILAMVFGWITNKPNRHSPPPVDSQETKSK